MFSYLRITKTLVIIMIHLKIFIPLYKISLGWMRDLQLWMYYKKEGTKCWLLSILSPNPMTHHVGIYLHPHHDIVHTLIILLNHILLHTMNHMFNHTLHDKMAQHMSVHHYYIDHIQRTILCISTLLAHRHSYQTTYHSPLHEPSPPPK